MESVPGQEAGANEILDSSHLSAFLSLVTMHFMVQPPSLKPE